MEKIYNPPVSIQVYLGSGKYGERLRANLVLMAGNESVSKMILKILKKGAPKLFKGIEGDNDGK